MWNKLPPEEEFRLERIQKAFEKRKGKAAILPFLTAGDPNFDDSLACFRALLQAGADLVEIGIPYSDPLADGKVIQDAALRSLQSGFSLPRIFEMTQLLRRESEAGLILFSYVNPVFQYGFERFFQDAKKAGADGIIIPDLPFEESVDVRQAADAADIALIPLVTPTSGRDRIASISSEARGFVYCVSSLGVTGERVQMSERVEELVRTVRQSTTLPVAVGFGVSTPEQAQNIAAYADGVIVGSAFVRRIGQSLDQGQDAMLSTITEFFKELQTAVQ